MESFAVALVGGGLAEWPSGTGPRGETIAPAAFVDVTGAEHLLELPRHFHGAEASAWHAVGMLASAPPALHVSVKAPIESAFHIPIEPGRHAALVTAMLRDGGIYVVPTTPRYGINARIARDGSVWVAVDASNAETWKVIRGA